MRKLSIVFLLLLAPLVANGQPYHVGGDVKAPVAIVHVNPVYPEEARRERISGIVILETLIDHTGVVKEVSVLKPLPHGLSEAAVAAVKQWLFKPGTLKGEAVDVIFNVTINFSLDKAPDPEPH
jgi:TonB family protein